MLERLTAAREHPHRRTRRPQPPAAPRERRARRPRRRAGDAARRSRWRPAPCVAVGLGRCSTRRSQELHAAAAPRGHHPPAGGRQGPRPGADRRRHLHGVALRRPDVVRRRQGPDADPARDRRLHRPPVRRHRVRAGRPRRRRRSTSPTAPSTSSTCWTSTAAARCWRSPPTTRGRARSTSGSALGGEEFTVEAHPVPGDARTTCRRCSTRARSTASSTSASWASEPRAVAALFALNGFVVSSLYARLPAIKDGPRRSPTAS